MRGWLVLLAVLLAWPAEGWAQARLPSREPFLRVDTGMHNAAIRRIVATPDGNTIVTVSFDKSVRVWRPDGSLVRTLRLPTGNGPLGQLAAAAISPNGRYLALGGNAGLGAGGWEENVSLYFLSLEDGRLERAPRLISAAVNALAWSPDGDVLAVGFTNGGGVRLIDVAKLPTVGDAGGDPAWVDLNPREPRPAVESLAFARDGRLAASGSDGFVRVYPAGRPLRPPVRQQILDVSGLPLHPGDVAFSPDGRVLAVGMANLPTVTLLDAATLQPRKPLVLGRAARPDNQHMRAVAWLEHGGRTSLFAGGHILDAAGNFQLLRWDALDKPPVAQAAVGRDTVLGLTALPGARVAFATADPAWGIFNAALERQVRPQGSIALFRQAAQGVFRVSDDGLTVDFGMAPGGKMPHRFDVVGRRLMPLPTAAPAPRELPARLPLGNWVNNNAPELGGQRLKLPSGELTRSVAAPADASFFVLGTDTHLRPYLADGTAGTPFPLPAAAWAVTLTGDGKTLVAGLGDGTLRWYAASPSGLRWLAALFPHGDGRRWVLWTPEGFFDHADEGGQDLVGYVLNREARQTAEWINFAQLYRVFYAPELVQGRLARKPDDALQARLAGIGDVRTLIENRRPPAVALDSVCYQEPQSGRDVCREVHPGPNQTRGIGRVVENAAPEPATAPATTPVPATARPVPAAKVASPPVDLPAGVTRIRLQATVASQGGGIGHVDFFLNDHNAGRQAQTRGMGRQTKAPETAPAPEPEAGPRTPEAAQPVPDAPRTVQRELRLEPGANLIQVRAFEASNGTFGESEQLEIRIAEPPAPIKPTLHVLAVGVDAYRPAWIDKLSFAVKDATAFVRAVETAAAPGYAAVNAILLKDGDATKEGIAAAFKALGPKVQPQDTVLIYLAGHGVRSVNDRYVFLPDIPPDSQQGQEEDVGITDELLLEWWSQLPAQNSIALIDTCYSGSLNFAGTLANEAGRYVLTAATRLQPALDGFNGNNGLFAVTVLEALKGEGRRRLLAEAVDNFNLGWHVRDRVPQLAQQRGFQQAAEFRGHGAMEPFALTRMSR